MSKESGELLRVQIADLIAELSATAYLNPTTARNDLDAGRAVVIVKPPRLEYPTFGTTNAEWSVIVAAGPADDYVAAWDRLDEVLDAIAQPLGAESAEPSTYKVSDTKGYPAYVLKITT